VTPAAIALGCVALLARPAAPVGALAVTVGVGIMGALAPVPGSRTTFPGYVRWVAVSTIGVAAFAAGRLAQPPAHVTIPPLLVSLPLIAAVAEEIFFRRLVYGWLIPGGPVLAIGGAAVAFAVVHLPAYGVRAMPVDVAAGVLLGWQRWASGGWSAPGVTHVVANFLQMW
jgi:membrane protease YdiL (CAAX protease family)